MPVGSKAVPAVAQKYFNVGMKIGRAEFRRGTVVDAGHEARGDVHRAAQGDHQMREIAAHAGLFDHGVGSRGVAVGAAGEERGAAAYPILDGGHARVAGRKVREFPGGQFAEAVGLAIAAGVDVAQHFGRQLGDRHFMQVFRLLGMVAEVNRGAVVDG